jgi:ribosomal protein L24
VSFNFKIWNKYMRKIIFFIILTSVWSLSIFAQSADGIKANLASGEVLSIDQSGNKITLKTVDGNIDAILSAKTIFKKVSAEKPSFKTAADSSISEIAVGDKVMVTGLVEDNKKSLPAKAVYLLSKSELSQRRAKELEDWKLRGISGKVKAINPATKEITVTTKSLAGDKDIVVSGKDGILFRRFAETSIDIKDAKPGKFEEVKVGDQVRARGDKSADGLKFGAEEFLSGLFQTTAGKITAIDLAKQEVTIQDLNTKKSIVVAVNSSSLMKKFPAEMATMLAMRSQGGGGFPAGGGQPGGTVVTMRPPNTGGTGVPTDGSPNGQMGGGFRGGAGAGGGRGDVDDMLVRLPTISLADVKIGDAIAAVSGGAIVQNRVMAFKFIAGVEPFLTAPQIPGGGRGQGGGQGGGNFNIPGLDGFGF